MFFAILSAVSTGVIAALGSAATSVSVATGTMIGAGCGLATAAGDAALDAMKSIF